MKRPDDLAARRASWDNWWRRMLSDLLAKEETAGAQSAPAVEVRLQGQANDPAR